MNGDLSAAALARHAARLFARRRGTMLFFSGCLALGIAFLSAVSHLLSAVDVAVAARARDLLSGDLQATASRPFTEAEDAAFSRSLTPGRRAARGTTLASMLAPAGPEAPFLVAVKAVDDAYPLRGKLETTPPGARPGPGECLLERSAALQHGLKAGDAARLGRLNLRIAGLIDKEPDRDFLGFSFAPRLMISTRDLPRAGLLGLGSRVRYSWTLALADSGDPDAAARAAKSALEKNLADPHVSVASYTDGEPSVRDGLRRSALFFTALSLAALLLGAAGLRAGLILFLDAEAPSMGLLRCLGATAGEVERLYGGLCLAAGLAGGGLGAAAGWVLAAAAARGAARFGLELTAPPRAGIFAECLLIAGALSWGLSAARVRALAARAPLDALRAPPPTPKLLAAAGWAAALAVVATAAWLRAPSGTDALKIVGALAAGAALIEGLSRAALRAAARLAHEAGRLGLPFPIRHGMRRLARRPAETRVMIFTLAGGFALLASVGTAREGFARALAPAQSVDAPDLFLVDVQPPQVEKARALAARFSRGEADFAPLVRARLTRVDGEALQRGDLRREGEDGRDRRRARSREYNLTYADAPNASETILKGAFWKPGAAGAEASVERDFAEHAGLKLGSRLTFDVSGREVEATVTSIRRVEWSSMRPNFFVTLSPELIRDAPRTFIASLRARDPAASAGLRRALSRELPNVSVIDAAALLETARRTLGLMLTAVEALAWFCVVVGMLVTAGLVALGRGERASEGALERALGWSAREALAADAAELLGLGALSAACGACAAVFLAWALARRLEVPLAADRREVLVLVAAALFLPALSGLLAGAPARRAAALDALRRDG
jgi:putative ABC transport system permease protein